MFRNPFWSRLLLVLVAVVTAGPLPAAADDASPAPAARQAFVTGDGKSIPIQQDWTVEQDPAGFEGVPQDQVPYRYDLRQPSLIHVEKRPGKRPLYYFRDVRWELTERPAGATVGRRALFTTVVIDVEKVKKAHLCYTPFAPTWVAGHAAIELEFDSGGFRTLDGKESSGLVWSYEARLRCNQSYAILPSLYKKIPILFVVGRWDDFLFRCVTLNKSVIRRWKLEVAPERLAELAEEMGKAVVADNQNETYNAVSNSCITRTLRVLTRFLPDDQRSSEDWLFGLIKNPRWVVPVLVDDLLKSKGLIRSPEQVFGTLPASAGRAEGE